MNPTPASRTVRVQPGGSSATEYDVLIGSGTLGCVGAWVSATFGPGTRVLVIQDGGVPRKHADAIIAGLDPSGFGGSVVTWQPEESTKSLQGATLFLEHLAREAFDRRSVIVALGGGITGDVAGFVAAVYQRGIAWVNCPSTLLAMVDAAVGGKTGVNLALGSNSDSTLKNMVGAVHQPSLVAADIDTLQSLPNRTFLSGLAECVKHGMIGADWDDPGLMDWMHANREAVMGRTAELLCNLIARNIALKAAVVAADERELADGPGGGRMALNLGHTFAHAIETLPNLSWGGQQSLTHGEAVALGLIAASRCAEAMKLVSGSIADEVAAIVKDFGLPQTVQGLPDDGILLKRMAHDKKARSGALRVILPVARGRVQVVSNPPIAAVLAGLASIRG